MDSIGWSASSSPAVRTFGAFAKSQRSSSSVHDTSSARFRIRVPLLPSEEHHSHKIHSPYCIENGGEVNCTEAPLLELEEGAAHGELGTDPNPNFNPSPNPNPSPIPSPTQGSPELGARLFFAGEVSSVPDG